MERRKDEWKDGTKTDNGILYSDYAYSEFYLLHGFGLGPNSDLVSDPTWIWSRTQLGFGLGPNSDLVSDPGLSEPGYSEDGYSEVTWNPVTPNTTTILWCSTFF